MKSLDSVSPLGLGKPTPLSLPSNQLPELAASLETTP